MPVDSTFTPRWGTALATFTQRGTYSTAVQINGRLAALYSDDWPSAAGSVVIRASANPSGSGWPAQTAAPVAATDGTILKTLSFGSGTYYALAAPLNMAVPLIPFVVLQIGTAGTAGAAAGGTIVLVVEER